MTTHVFVNEIRAMMIMKRAFEYICTAHGTSPEMCVKKMLTVRSRTGSQFHYSIILSKCVLRMSPHISPSAEQPGV